MSEQSSNAVATLREKIDELVDQASDMEIQYNNIDDDDEAENDLDSEIEKIHRKLERLIDQFVIPRDREGLLEFVEYAQAFKDKNAFNTNTEVDELVGKKLRKRYKDAVRLVQTLYPNDPEFLVIMGDDAKGNGNAGVAPAGVSGASNARQSYNEDSSSKKGFLDKLKSLFGK